MTENEKYAELMKEVGEMFANKNLKIYCLEAEVKALRQKVAELESGKVCAKRIEVRKDI